MSLPTGSEPNRVLLVEGRDDKYVVDHIRRRHDPMPPFEIVDKGGLEELLASIGPELKAHGRRALGIVVDANDDIEARWAAVTDRLGRAGIEVGDRDPGGTVIRGTSSDSCLARDEKAAPPDGAGHRSRGSGGGGAVCVELTEWLRRVFGQPPER